MTPVLFYIVPMHKIKVTGCGDERRYGTRKAEGATVGVTKGVTYSGGGCRYGCGDERRYDKR